MNKYSSKNKNWSCLSGREKSGDFQKGEKREMGADGDPSSTKRDRGNVAFSNSTFLSGKKKGIKKNLHKELSRKDREKNARGPIQINSWDRDGTSVSCGGEKEHRDIKNRGGTRQESPAEYRKKRFRLRNI